MNTVFERLIEVANQTGQPAAVVLRHHFLEGVLRRSSSLEEPSFVLRGSMLTRLWASPFSRQANDIDFLGTFPHSVDETARRFLPRLFDERDDGIRFDPDRCTARGIWEESRFPGVRLTLWADVLGEIQTTTVDIGFGDPLVPPAKRIDYSLLTGETIPVWAVHPATLAAWKLHGLAEWGKSRWRPKDMLDLWLLTGRFRFAPEVLADAIRAAYESRAFSVGDACRTLSEPFWNSAGSQARWSGFRREYPRDTIPESLHEVRSFVQSRLQPALDLLSSTVG